MCPLCTHKYSCTSGKKQQDTYGTLFLSYAFKRHNSLEKVEVFTRFSLCDFPSGLFTFGLSRHKKMIKMSDYLPRIPVWLIKDRLRDARFTQWHQGRQPFAIYVDAVFDSIMFSEGQRETMTDHLQKTRYCICSTYKSRLKISFTPAKNPHLHEPGDLSLVIESGRLCSQT